MTEDAIYDKKLKELRDLETRHNFVFPDSPTQKPGYAINNKLQPVIRPTPMLSLDISLIYQNHHLTQVSTRGSGDIGEDVTFNKYLIKDIPFFLEKVNNCEVRGEVYMKKSEFQLLNAGLAKNTNKLLANPRNAAAGSLRTLIPLQVRKLNFFAYQLFNNDLATQLACLQELEEIGFSEKRREKLDFESDGIVVKVNNYDYYQKLGQTTLATTSQVKNVYTEVSRNGRITYVAEIVPVILQGSKISKVTLHNYAFIRNLNLNIGDEVVIKKAGDVIPQITQIIKSDNSDNLCANINCPQKVINYLTHFAAKKGVDIQGLSQKNIKKLYQNNLLKSPEDFYHLGHKKEELLKLEGFQEKVVIKAKKLTTFYPNLTSFLTAVKNEE
ncbi:10398_t:CDS:2 [Entrophospora sp. SA101]|nr:10398_t:CDS:2 [Entrophospora sp. SA101]